MGCSCKDFDKVSYEEFLPYILPSAGEVPDEIAAHMARVSAIELASQTKTLKRTVTLDAQAGVAHYRLCIPDDYSLVTVDYLKYGCSTLTINREADPFSAPEFSCRRWYAFDKPDTIYINPVPNCDGVRDIEVGITVLPGQDSCYIDRFFYDEHAELIAHGALMRIYRMKAEDWFDPRQAREEERLWRDGLRTAKVRALKGHSSQPLRMRASRFI